MNDEFPQFDFDLVLRDSIEINTEFENQLYESACGDATISVSAGVMVLSFSRCGEHVIPVVLNAIRDIRESKLFGPVRQIVLHQPEMNAHQLDLINSLLSLRADHPQLTQTLVEALDLASVST